MRCLSYRRLQSQVQTVATLCDVFQFALPATLIIGALLSVVSGAKNTLNLVDDVLPIDANKISVRELMSVHERLLLFGHESSEEPHYDVFEGKGMMGQNAAMARNAKTRVRRSVSDEPDKLQTPTAETTKQTTAKHFPRQMDVNFGAFGEAFNLVMTRNPKLLSPGFALHEESGAQDEDMRLPTPNCYYQGYSSSHPNSSAALSMCDGMRGIIETGNAIYVINPLPKQALNKYNNLVRNSSTANSRPHIVLKKESLDYQCPHQRRAHLNGTSALYSDVLGSMSAAHVERTKRAIATDQDSFENSASTGSNAKRAVTVETAVFVDETLYDIMKQTFPVDTEQEIVTYVLTIMNAVQLLFKAPSLGRSVDISVVLMDILKVQPRDLTSSDNIDTYLTNFCVWQHNKRIHSRGLTPRWDHALLLSGINMYVVDGHGRKKRHVVGLAPVSGMCNSLNSCTISEGTSFQTVLVAGHELGHSLGMEHDGSQDGNACDQDDFIMSPTLGAGKTSWSSCSRDYLEKFLLTAQASCVLATSSHVNILRQFSSQNKLPGQLFDANQQCALRFGSDSRKSQLQTSEDICRLLRCDTGTRRNIVAYHAHPALEGTSCGRDKWCREGNCVSMELPAQSSDERPVTSLTARGAAFKKSEAVIDGQWGGWSAFGSCASECIIRTNAPAVGVMISQRKCDNPQPLNNGKYCEGSDKRVKLCDASKMCLSSPVFRMVTTNEYINDICIMAARRDSNLEPRGTQYPSYDHSHSCYVWCHKRGGGYMTQGWKLPDGTPCGRETSIAMRSGASKFCVNGECRPFDCNGYSGEQMNNEPCLTSGVGHTLVSAASTAAANTKLKSSSLGWGSWLPLSGCHFSCLANSRGVRLVTRECNSVGQCPGKKDWFQLCSSADDNCLVGASKTGEQHANDVCQKYRIKYPTLLSGRGRQLAPRTENPHSSCIVACQDRVWRDIHYQMDAFDDGKFPLGTDCSLGTNSRHKAYCINGKCVKFDENDVPVDESVDDMQHVRHYLSSELRYRNRHRRSANMRLRTQQIQDAGEPFLIDRDNRRLPSWRPIRPSRPLRLASPPDALDNSTSVLRVQPYQWGMSISDCTKTCGSGRQSVVVFCHAGRFVLNDSFCDISHKPAQGGLRPCNSQPCMGSWRAEEWGQCSSSCGHGFRSRTVACVEKTTDANLFRLVDHNMCALDERPKHIQVCDRLPPCTFNHRQKRG